MKRDLKCDKGENATFKSKMIWDRNRETSSGPTEWQAACLNSNMLTETLLNRVWACFHSMWLDPIPLKKQLYVLGSCSSLDVPRLTKKRGISWPEKPLISSCTCLVWQTVCQERLWHWDLSLSAWRAWRHSRWNYFVSWTVGLNWNEPAYKSITEDPQEGRNSSSSSQVSGEIIQDVDVVRGVDLWVGLPLQIFYLEQGKSCLN